MAEPPRASALTRFVRRGLNVLQCRLCFSWAAPDLTIIARAFVVMPVSMCSYCPASMAPPRRSVTRSCPRHRCVRRRKEELGHAAHVKAACTLSRLTTAALQAGPLPALLPYRPFLVDHSFVCLTAVRDRKHILVLGMLYSQIHEPISKVL